jgi:hypothetical protein
VLEAKHEFVDTLALHPGQGFIPASQLADAVNWALVEVRPQVGRDPCNTIGHVVTVHAVELQRISGIATESFE